jgi:hypothetical protein
LQDFKRAGNNGLFLWGVRQTGKSLLLRKKIPAALTFDLLQSEVYHRLLIIVDGVQINTYSFECSILALFMNHFSNSIYRYVAKSKIGQAMALRLLLILYLD